MGKGEVEREPLSLGESFLLFPFLPGLSPEASSAALRSLPNKLNLKLGAAGFSFGLSNVSVLI
jgi:hypothetical protein